MPLKKPIYIPADLHHRLKIRASLKNKTLMALTSEVLTAWLAENNAEVIQLTLDLGDLDAE